MLTDGVDVFREMSPACEVAEGYRKEMRREVFPHDGRFGEVHIRASGL